MQEGDGMSVVLTWRGKLISNSSHLFSGTHLAQAIKILTTKMPTNDSNKENQRPKIAIIVEGKELTDDERLTALRHCPIVRMGRVQQAWGQATSSHGQQKTCVIPADICIGCGICVRRVGGGKLEMVEW